MYHIQFSAAKSNGYGRVAFGTSFKDIYTFTPFVILSELMGLRIRHTNEVVVSSEHEPMDSKAKMPKSKVKV